MIRKLQAEDREQLKDIIYNINNFTDEEKSVALELIDEALSKPEQNYYNVFVYENDGKILGYHCVGKRALTDGVFDLYWIVVSSQAQDKGIGKILLDHCENFVKENSGRWIFAETSSKDNYTATRNFYMRNNYSIVTQIKDFYSVGDNLIVFGKYFKT
ncbi:MAG: GNAT family N-acetyltransferase [Ignavibacteriales bacterium]|jgi:aminoglycoside 6'-N-acetyltransferase I|nr:GNAT family N-acetyltransferase [Ignavibacteriales bacterium]